MREVAASQLMGYRGPVVISLPCILREHDFLRKGGGGFPSEYFDLILVRTYSNAPKGEQR